MELLTQLQSDMKQAMRDRDTEKLGVIRFLISEIKNKSIDSGEVSEEQIHAIIKKQIKQIQESVTELEKAQRSELIAEENAKKEILSSYLPKQMDEEEIVKIVAEVKEESGETHFGKLTGLVMKRVAGKADGATVSRIIRESFK